MTRPNFVAAQTLLTVARLGTFTAAASYLNTTQSAISARMRELERSLGYALFTRQGRRLQLTIPAQQLIEHIEPLIEALEDVFHDAEAVDNPRGTVRIGLAEISITWFSQLIKQLDHDMPRLQFTIEVDLSAVVQEALENGSLDMGIVAIPKMSKMLRYRSLGKTSLSWVCSTSLLADSGGMKRTLEQLLREELLWNVPKNSPFHIPAREELAALGADLSHLCTSSKGLLDIALAGGGIVLLPHTMAKPYLENGRLSRVSDALGSHELELFLVAHKNQRQKAIAQMEDVLINIARLTPPSAAPINPGARQFLPVTTTSMQNHR